MNWRKIVIVDHPDFAYWAINHQIQLFQIVLSPKIKCELAEMFIPLSNFNLDSIDLSRINDKNDLKILSLRYFPNLQHLKLKDIFNLAFI